jgi:hypothetical protein
VGVGLSLGVAFCGKLRRWPHWKGLPYLSLLLLGVGMIGFSRLTDYGSALIGCICLGFLGSLIAIPIESRLQHEVSNQLRGRVFALRNLCTTTSFLIALGLNLSGTLLAQRGATQMIADLGMGVTAMALILSAWNRAQLRTFWAVPTPAT